MNRLLMDLLDPNLSVEKNVQVIVGDTRSLFLAMHQQYRAHNLKRQSAEHLSEWNRSEIT